MTSSAAFESHYKLVDDWDAELKTAVAHNTRVPEAAARAISDYLGNASNFGKSTTVVKAAILVHQTGSYAAAALRGGAPAIAAGGCIAEATMVTTGRFLLQLAHVDPADSPRIAADLVIPLLPKLVTNVVAYLTETAPQPGDPGNEPFASPTLGVFSDRGDNALRVASCSAAAKTSSYFSHHPRMLLAQALLVLCRNYQLTAKSATEITTLFDSITKAHARVVHFAGLGSRHHQHAAAGPYATIVAASEHVCFMVGLAHASAHSPQISLYAATTASTRVVLAPNALVRDPQLGRHGLAWIGALRNQLSEIATAYVDATTSAVSGSAGARESVVAECLACVDGFVSIATLTVGLLSDAQGEARGLDMVVDAFRGDRRDRNQVSNPRSLVYRGKVAKRLLALCPPSGRLLLPTWVIPGALLTILQQVFSDNVLFAVKHLSDLDVSAARAFVTAQEDAARALETSLQQERDQQSATAAGSAGPVVGSQVQGVWGGRLASSRSAGGAGRPLPVQPTVRCMAFSSTIAHLLDLIAHVFEFLPLTYLCSARHTPDAQSADDQPANAGDSPVATFVFENVLRHFQGLFQEQTESKGAASSSGGAVGGQPLAEQWDPYLTKAVAAYIGLLAMLCENSRAIADRVMATIINDSQMLCLELQLGNLVRQLQAMLFGGPSSSSAVAAGQQQGRVGQYQPLLGGAAPIHGDSTEQLVATRLRPEALVSGGAERQMSPQYLRRWQQRCGKGILNLIAAIGAHPNGADITLSVPLLALLNVFDAPCVSPLVLGAALEAIAEISPRVGGALPVVWQHLEHRGLLRCATTGGGHSASGGVAGGELNSIPGHCIRESHEGRYPITRGFLRFLLRSLLAQGLTPIAMTGPNGSDQSQQPLSAAATDPTAHAKTPAKKSQPSADIVALVAFVAEDVLRSLHRRAYADPEEHNVLAALACEVLHVAMTCARYTSHTRAVFHSVIATSRAPADTVGALLGILREAVCDTSVGYAFSSHRTIAVRLAIRLLHTTMHVLRSDTGAGGLLHTAFTFNARTFENADLVVALIHLACSTNDNVLARRCFAILTMFDGYVTTTATRTLLHERSSNASRIALSLAAILNSATSAVAVEGGGEVLQVSDVSALMRSLDQDALREVEVPSTASSLLDLLIHSAPCAAPSLASWMCGFRQHGQQSTTIEPDFCLSPILRMCSDGDFAASAATAPLAAKAIRVLHLLLCNGTTATRALWALLCQSGNFGFVTSIATLSDLLPTTVAHAGGGGASTGGAASSTSASSRYDRTSTVASSAALHLMDFCGYALRISALHTHRVSAEWAQRRQQEREDEISKHVVNGIELKSSYGLGGRQSTEAASALLASQDPITVEVFRLLSGPSNGERSISGATRTLTEHLLCVLESLPTFPMVSVPGDQNERFIIHTPEKIPQYSVPMLHAELARLHPNANAAELRERLRIFVYANACLFAYFAATNFVSGWVQLLDVVCASTNTEELPLDLLLAFGGALASALPLTERLTQSAQVAIVSAVSRGLCSVIFKVRDVCLGDPAKARAAATPLAELLTVAVDALVQFGAVSSVARRNLYNVLRVLLALPFVDVDVRVLKDQGDALIAIIMQDVTSGAAAASDLRQDEPTCALMGLQCLRRLIDLPEMAFAFAVSNHTEQCADDPVLQCSRHLAALTRAMNITFEAAVGPFFARGEGGGADAAYLAAYAEVSSDILVQLVRCAPMVVFTSGVVEDLSAAPFWGILSRFVSNLTAAGLVEARIVGSAKGPLFSASSAGALAPRHEPGGHNGPSTMAAFMQHETASAMLAHTLAWLTALLEEGDMRDNAPAANSVADFVRAHFTMFQSITHGHVVAVLSHAAVSSRDGPSPQVHTPQNTVSGADLRLIELTTLLLRLLGSTALARECRTLVATLSLPDLLLTLSSPEITQAAVFVDAQNRRGMADAQHAVQVAAPTAAHLLHILRSVRNLTHFLVEVAHPMDVEQREREAGIATPADDAWLLESEPFISLIAAVAQAVGRLAVMAVTNAWRCATASEASVRAQLEQALCLADAPLASTMDVLLLLHSTLLRLPRDGVATQAHRLIRVALSHAGQQIERMVDVVEGPSISGALEQAGGADAVPHRAAAMGSSPVSQTSTTGKFSTFAVSGVCRDVISRVFTLRTLAKQAHKSLEKVMPSVL